MRQQKRSARGPAKPPADTEGCLLSAHQELANTTLFKVCPNCGEPLEAYRQHPIEVMKRQQSEATVLAAVDGLMSEDERFVNNMAGGLRDFLRGVAGFFLTSAEIEKSAKHTLAEFQALKQPTNLDEDMALVQKIRNANVEWDVAKKHHEPVTSLFNAMHKRAVAWRKRPLDLLEQGINRGNLLHNNYAAEAERKAREEEDRKRREEEQRAREQRERELQASEDEAIRAEEASADLTARESAFVEAVVIFRLDAIGAARRAGFKNPPKDAARLMGLVKIVNAIDGLKKARAIREQAKATAAAPLEVAPVEKVKPEISGGSRETRSAEVYDEKAFMAALLDPTQRLHFGIPAEIATFSQTKLNQQARTLDEQINRWPGVRLRKDRGVV